MRSKLHRPDSTTNMELPRLEPQITKEAKNVFESRIQRKAYMDI
jgi:hypothetical protein